MKNGLSQNLYVETCRQQSWPAKYEINNGSESVTFNDPDQLMMIRCEHSPSHAEAKPSVRTIQDSKETMKFHLARSARIKAWTANGVC